MGDVQAYLEGMIFIRKNIPKPEGFVYGSVEEFVYTNGRAFQPAPFPKSGFYRGKMKECFMNAFLLTWNHPKKFTYVEGFATTGILPVLHAWVVTDNGDVIDPTWGDDGTEYFGVPFDWKFLMKLFKNKKYYGFIDDWRMKWPLLQGKYKRGEFVSKKFI